MNYEHLHLIAGIGILVLAVFYSCRHLRHEYVVEEGFVGMLHRHGILVDALPAGRHTCWGRNCSITLIDNRRTVHLVASQEALTADDANVNVSVALTTQVVNAVKAVQAAAGNHAAHLCNAAQTAIRTAIAEVGIADLPGLHTAIASAVLQGLARLEDTIGVHVHEVDVRDITILGGIRITATHQDDS